MMVDKFCEHAIQCAARAYKFASSAGNARNYGLFYVDMSEAFREATIANATVDEMADALEDIANDASTTGNPATEDYVEYLADAVIQARGAVNNTINKLEEVNASHARKCNLKFGHLVN